jgi:hypothetical protein
VDEPPEQQQITLRFRGWRPAAPKETAAAVENELTAVAGRVRRELRQ